MQAAQVQGGFFDAWGLGWELDQIDGVRIVGHGGTTNGYQARLALVPSARFAVVVLTNSNRGVAACQEIADAALARYAGLRRPKPVLVDLPATDVAPFAGRYERPGTEIELSLSDAGGDSAPSRLHVQVTTRNVFTGEPVRQPRWTAAPTGPRRFAVLDPGVQDSAFDFPFDDTPPRFLRFGGRLAERVS